MFLTKKSVGSNFPRLEENSIFFEINDVTYDVIIHDVTHDDIVAWENMRKYSKLLSFIFIGTRWLGEILLI